MTLWGYVADPLIFGVSHKVWNTFTKEDQEIVRQAAIDAGAVGIAAARKGLTAEDDSLIKQVEGLGVEVTRLNAAERQAFVDATREVYKAWTAKIGADLVKMAEESVANR